VQQPHGRAVALRLLVVVQGIDREGGQAQHGLAGGGLEGRGVRKVRQGL
jgi:hypothetical protein